MMGASIKNLLFKLISLSFTVVIFIGSAFADEKSDLDAGKIFKTNCATCHTIGKGVVVGPDLKDFHTRQTLDWTLSWVKSSSTVIRSGDDYAVALFDEYNRVEMPDQNLSEEEITAVYNFIKEESAKVVEAPVAVVAAGDDGSAMMYLTIIALVLLVVLFVLNNVATTLNNLINEKQGNEVDARGEVQRMFASLAANKTVVTIVIIGVLLFGMNKGIQALSNLGIQHGYAPEQPINFPHDKHAGDMKIDCKYCHSGAEKSKTAGIPSANVCMNCHNVIKKDSPEIQKLYNYVENNIPIQWVKVHNLPDHVYFNHSQHVNIGGIECEHCHGKVEEMKVVRKDKAITMGFCIDCHRETAVKFEENNYYHEAAFADLHEQLKNGEIDMVTVNDIGGTECQKCHY